MNTIKKNEKKLYRFVTNADTQAIPVINELLDFWKRYDMLFHTNHYTIITTLSSPLATNHTFGGLALLLHIHERTLERYRKLYMKSYVSFCRMRNVEPFQTAA